MFGGLDEEEQAPAALVEDPGATQVRGGAASVGDFARQGGLKVMKASSSSPQAVS
ncbi:hypothetical protein GCM10010103_71910 [Streptomyces paradoxus]